MFAPTPTRSASRVLGAAVALAVAGGAGVVPGTARAQAGVGQLGRQADAGRTVAARAIEGDVVQAESGAALPGATVVLVPAAAGAIADAGGGAFVAAARRVVTGADGRYRFADVAAGAYVLHVYRLGFRPATVEVELGADPSANPSPSAVAASGAAASAATRGAADPPARVSVGLTVVPIRLRPVAVEASLAGPYARGVRGARATADARQAALRVRQARFLSTDAREVTHADVEDAVTFGETDLFRALQRLPGVATQGDASAQLWTRGARWDQTRVTFDGLPLFNPLHTGGLLSAVNSDAVGAAFLLPGVRPASIGEGSAAVLDLRSRAGGGTGALRGVGELSLLSGRAALDQTVAGGRGAWMVAARRSYLDLIVNRVARDSTGNPFPYHLGEVSGRADWRFAGGQALEVSALHSRDRLGDPVSLTSLQRFPAGWGNSAARVTLAGPARLGPLGPGTLRTTLGLSTYTAALDYFLLDLSSTRVPDTRRPVREHLAYATLAGEFTPRALDASPPEPGAGPRWSAGYALTAQRAVAEGSLATVYTVDPVDSTVASRGGTLPMLALWGERRFAPAVGLTVATGLRAEGGGSVRGDGPLRLSPRVTARYRPGGGPTAFSAAVGRHYQYLQGVAPPVATAESPEVAALRPVPLWVAADRSTPGLRTDLATAGLERWTGAGWDWTLNAYVRRSTGLALADEHPGPVLGRSLFVVGGETGRGIEVSVRRLVGRWTGGVSYALAGSTTRAYGLEFPSLEDRRHVLNATTGVRVGRGARFGASLTAASGSPVPPGQVLALRDSAGSFVADGPARLVAPALSRLPAFVRLDLMAEKSWAIRRARVGGYLQVINATNRQNPLGVGYPFTLVESGSSPPSAATGVPNGFVLLPLIGFRASF